MIEIDLNPFNFLLIAFGELDLSPLTVSILLFLTLFTFVSVIISSLKLFQSSFQDTNSGK